MSIFNNSISADEVIGVLSNMYIKAIENCVPFKKLPSAMLWGAPGIGKSDAVRQIAKKIEEDTYKHVNVVDVRLLLFNPIDLRGIPTANADKSLAIWLKPKIFDMNEDSSVVNILFLDEISAAPQSVQAAAYQIVLDRIIGEHNLPANCIVIAAGNRVTDRSVAYKMPKALANRLLHFEIEGSFVSWKRWAINNGINPMVIGFLSFKQNYLFGFDSEADDLAFPTPRTWEMVSNVLNYIDNDVNNSFEIIAGLIGRSAAIEFRSWTKVYKKLPSIEGIFEGTETRLPKTPDAIYSVITSLTEYMREHEADMTGMRNSIKYISKLPPEYLGLLIENYKAISSKVKIKLMTLPEVIDYCEKELK